MLIYIAAVRFVAYPWSSKSFASMFIVSETYSREQTLIVEKIASEHNGSDFVFVEDPEAKEELWRVS